MEVKKCLNILISILINGSWILKNVTNRLFVIVICDFETLFTGLL